MAEKNNPLKQLIRAPGISGKLVLIFSGVSVCLLLFLGVLHYNAGMKAIELEQKMKLVELGDRLSASLKQPIYEFANSTVDDITKAEFPDDEVSAIFIWTENKEKLILGLMRYDGRVIENDAPPDGPTITSASRTIYYTSLSGQEEPIAQLDIYLDKKVPEGDLKKSVLFKLGEDALILFLLSATLAFVVNRFVVEPLEIVRQAMLNMKMSGPVNKKGRAIEGSKELKAGFKEIYSLGLIFTSMTEIIYSRQQELLESEEKFRTILTAMEDMVFAFDSDGNFVFYHIGAEGELFMGPEFFMGKKYYEVMPGFIADKIKAVFERNKKGETGEFDYSLDMPSGPRWYEAKCSPKIIDGIYAGSIAVIRDITGRVRSEQDLKNTLEELKRSNQDLEQFAYVSSHDLKQPLRNLSMYSQLLQKKFGENLGDEGKSIIKYITDGAVKMDMLIKDILEYSRAGRFEKKMEKVMVSQILNTIKKSYLDAGKRCRIVFDEKTMPEIHADRTALSQVFDNLINNACKFNKSEVPEVEITLENKEGFWEFSLKDNGIGIDPQYSEKVFKIFESLNTPDEYEGTGIGLSICKKIVERFGGKIWLISEGEGKGGTTFHFTLPA